MASALTLYPLDRVAYGSNFMALQVGGAAPSALTTATGWTLATVSLDNYSLFAYGTKRASATFNSVPLPGSNPDNSLGDCMRTDLPLSGQFSSANWDFGFPVIAVTIGGLQSGRMRVRLWRSRSPTASSPVWEITAGAQQAAEVTSLTTITEQLSNLTTYNPGVFNLSNEYLFVQLAWRITVAALLGGADSMVRVGSTSRIITSAFTTAEDLYKVGAGMTSGV